VSRILIVEDDPWIQREIQTALQEHGHDLMPASNGITGLARACVTPPDLILSDVVMPMMDGYAFLTRVREHRRLSRTPFVFLTSRSVAADLQRGFRLGADDYVPKPFKAKELIERVDRLLHLRTRKPVEERIIEPEPAPPGVGLTGSLNEVGFGALLTVLAMEHKTGMILVRDGRMRARVFMRAGQIVSARLDHGPELRNEEAVYWLLQSSVGRFEYRAMAVEMADEIRAPTAYLILEAARRRDIDNHRATAANS